MVSVRDSISLNGYLVILTVNSDDRKLLYAIHTMTLPRREENNNVLYDLYLSIFEEVGLPPKFDMKLNQKFCNKELYA